MSTLTLGPRLFDPGPTLFDETDTAPVTGPGPGHLAPTLRKPPAGPTLDDLIVAEWEQITSGGPASCPVCHGELAPVWSAAPRPVGGRCQDCGSRLS
jgi:hypothetical protein